MAGEAAEGAAETRRLLCAMKLLSVCHPCFGRAWAAYRGARPRGGGAPPTRRWRARENRVGEGADGDGDEAGEALALPVDGRAAHGQKWKVSALPLSAERVQAVDWPAKVICSRRKRAWLLMHGAGAALALQAVAHGDAHRLAFDGEIELSAVAGGRRVVMDIAWAWIGVATLLLARLVSEERTHSLWMTVTLETLQQRCDTLRAAALQLANLPAFSVLCGLIVAGEERAPA